MEDVFNPEFKFQKKLISKPLSCWCRGIKVPPLQDLIDQLEVAYLQENSSGQGDSHESIEESNFITPNPPEIKNSGHLDPSSGQGNIHESIENSHHSIPSNPLDMKISEHEEGNHENEEDDVEYSKSIDAFSITNAHKHPPKHFTSSVSHRETNSLRKKNNLSSSSHKKGPTELLPESSHTKDSDYTPSKRNENKEPKATPSYINKQEGTMTSEKEEKILNIPTKTLKELNIIDDLTSDNLDYKTNTSKEKDNTALKKVRNIPSISNDDKGEVPKIDERSNENNSDTENAFSLSSLETKKEDASPDTEDNDEHELFDLLPSFNGEERIKLLMSGLQTNHMCKEYLESYLLSFGTKIKIDFIPEQSFAVIEMNTEYEPSLIVSNLNSPALSSLPEFAGITWEIL